MVHEPMVLARLFDRAVRASEYSWGELAELFEVKRGPLGAVLPVGSLEQHGPHLPLGTDFYIAEGVAAHLAMNLWETGNGGALVLPSVQYAPCPGCETVAGTASISFDVFGGLVQNVLNGALNGTPWDFLVIVNQHSHNEGRLFESCVWARKAYGDIPVVLVNCYRELDSEAHSEICFGSHAGELEIALMHYYYGHVPSSGDVSDSAVVPRAYGVFGLDVMRRSFGGAIADRPPRPEVAVQNAGKLGQSLDRAVLGRVTSALECYDAYWKNG